MTNEPIKLRNKDSQLLVIYVLLGSLLLVSISSLIVYFYLDTKSKETNQVVTTAEVNDQQILEPNNNEVVVTTVAPTKEVIENTEQQPAEQESDLDIQVGVGDNSIETEQTVQQILDTQRQTGVLGTTEFRDLSNVYTISQDKKSILKDQEKYITIENGTIVKFAKPAWVRKFYIIINLGDGKYELREFSAVGRDITSRLMYRYEGVYKMVNMYIPSEYIVEDHAPRLFFLFYEYTSGSTSRFMAQRVEGFSVSKFEIQNLGSLFKGIETVSYDKDLQQITVVVDTSGGSKTLRFFAEE